MCCSTPYFPVWNVRFPCVLHCTDKYKSRSFLICLSFQIKFQVLAGRSSFSSMTDRIPALSLKPTYLCDSRSYDCQFWHMTVKFWLHILTTLKGFFGFFITLTFPCFSPQVSLRHRGYNFYAEHLQYCTYQSRMMCSFLPDSWTSLLFWSLIVTLSVKWHLYVPSMPGLQSWGTALYL